MLRRWAPTLVSPVLLVIAMASTLAWMGRSPICPCGSVGLWAGDVRSLENSQQFADAYSFIHVLFGVLLFWGLRPGRGLRPGWRAASMPVRVAAVTAFAVAWELIENSAFVIHRYREFTMSTAYAGDSILNSTGDVVFCLLGFYLASRLSWRASAAIVMVTEVVLGLWIHDGLLLNIVMLIHPIDAIRHWQLGA